MQCRVPAHCNAILCYAHNHAVLLRYTSQPLCNTSYHYTRTERGAISCNPDHALWELVGRLVVGGEPMPGCQLLQTVQCMDRYRYARPACRRCCIYRKHCWVHACMHACVHACMCIPSLQTNHAVAIFKAGQSQELHALDSAVTS